MEWEKPQLVDLNMVKYEPSCSDGGMVEKGICGPFGGGAAGLADGGCDVGSGVVAK